MSRNTALSDNASGVPRESPLTFLADDCFLRMGSSTVKATGPRIAAASKLFSLNRRRSYSRRNRRPRFPDDLPGHRPLHERENERHTESKVKPIVHYAAPPLLTIPKVLRGHTPS